MNNKYKITIPDEDKSENVEICRECYKKIYKSDDGYFDGLCPQCLINEDFNLDIDRDW